MANFKEREATSAAKIYFVNGQFAECIDSLNLVFPMSLAMLTIKAKSYYRLHQYSESIKATNEILGLSTLYGFV